MSKQLGDAAQPGEVGSNVLSSQQEQVLYGRQMNAISGSVTGSRNPDANDAQLAQQVAQFRQANCVDPASSACDAKVLQAMQHTQLAALKLTGAALAAGPTAAAVSKGPAAVSAAANAIRNCAANPVLCANTAGIVVADAAADGAIGAGALGATAKLGAAAGTTGTAVTEAERVALARTLNNFYRDGASPELLAQTFSQAALSSTHNAGSTEVVLGKYIAGSPQSYEAVAQTRGATYFSMSDWSAVQGQLGADQMWNINKAFLDQQIAAGKTFIFTADPRLTAAQFPTSYTAKELDHLVQSGYRIVNDGGTFRAIK